MMLVLTKKMFFKPVRTCLNVLTKTVFEQNLSTHKKYTHLCHFSFILLLYQITKEGISALQQNTDRKKLMSHKNHQKHRMKHICEIKKS